MKQLWILKKDDSLVEWDTFIGFVVCATTDEEALTLAVAGKNWYPTEFKLLGHASEHIPVGIVLHSFKYG